MTTDTPTVVLVHGAWHGSWCWQRLVPQLERRGIAVRTVDLPSVGASPGETVDLSADAAAVRAVLDDIPGNAVLCGHSYGGMVISLAASSDGATARAAVGSDADGKSATRPLQATQSAPMRVTQLIYLCAFMPEAGQSLNALGGGKPAPWISLLDGGLTLPQLDRAASLFYGDCDAQTQQWAIAQLRVQCGAAFRERVREPAWKAIRSTYVVCAQDQAMPPQLQHEVFAPRAAVVLELEASHSPFLSRPAELADAIARAVCGTSPATSR